LKSVPGAALRIAEQQISGNLTNRRIMGRHYSVALS